MFSRAIKFLKSHFSSNKTLHLQLDFIGDVHGYYDELVEFLKTLQYENIDGVWQHPDRKAVFVGDFVNRGPNSREVLYLVKSMVNNRKGYAILGNHELNMLGYFSTRKNGRPIANLPSSTRAQMDDIKKQFNNDKELNSYIKWLKKLPFYIDYGSARVVHAYWGDKNIRIIDTILAKSKLTKQRINEIFNKDTDFAKAVWQTTHGVEIDLPKDFIIKDSKNIRRTTFRIKWWESPENGTFKSVGFGNKFVLPEYTIPSQLLSPFEIYPLKAPLVIFGHYCIDSGPVIIRNNICCIDSCLAGKGTKLSGYRWQGEHKLVPNNLISHAKSIS